MQLGLKTERKPVTMSITVQTDKPHPIAISVRDAYKPATYYTKRVGTVGRKQDKNNTRTFLIKMPLSPDFSLIQVYNQKNGNLPEGKDRSFKLISKKVLPLEKSFNCYDSSNQSIKSFIKFAEEFSERASILSANRSVYMSDDGRFRIDYLDVVRDTNKVIENSVTGQRTANPNFGKPLSTPARISHNNGVIEISKHHFLQYTVPMRLAILFHEYSHFYLNKNIANESEADLNGLLLYLGNSWPKCEAHYAFLEVFKGTPSNENKIRMKKIMVFIKNFEDYKIKFC